jgi:Protein of unknown function (DUF3795)
MKPLDRKSLIAPCGMNCGICMAYLRERNKCPGCRAPDLNKPPTRTECKIKKCEILLRGGKRFCFTCEEFPCDRLKRLDKRYRNRYSMSMIENLRDIEADGIEGFLRAEETKWTCPVCGGTICVHKGCCSGCGQDRG